MSSTLYQLEDAVREQIREDWFRFPQHNPNYSGDIDEIVDGAIPVYTAELFEIAANHSDLRSGPSDPGMVDTSAEDYTIDKSISAALYEKLQDVAMTECQTLEGSWGRYTVKGGGELPYGAMVSPDEAHDMVDRGTPAHHLEPVEEGDEHCHVEQSSVVASPDDHEPEDVTEAQRLIDEGLTVRPEPLGLRLNYEQAQELIDSEHDGTEPNGGLREDALDRILEHAWDYDPTDLDALKFRQRMAAETEITQVVAL